MKKCIKEGGFIVILFRIIKFICFLLFEYNIYLSKYVFMYKVLNIIYKNLKNDTKKI